MTEVALRHILINESGKNYRIQFFKDTQILKRELQSKDFSAIIFSLSGNRRSRLESLLFLHEIARCCPETQRIILANDEAEMRLVSHLMPLRLHGILNKSACRIQLQEHLLQLLEHNYQPNESSVSQKQGMGSQILSPTEHAILRYMSYGYSLPEIATQLERNIKTIRAHKFNAMTKLGVSSAMGLLSAADILVRLSANTGDARVTRLVQ
jgi:DNA-binding NarL/FixJ family response regulator